MEINRVANIHDINASDLGLCNRHRHWTIGKIVSGARSCFWAQCRSVRRYSFTGESKGVKTVAKKRCHAQLAFVEHVNQRTWLLWTLGALSFLMGLKSSTVDPSHKEFYRAHCQIVRSSGELGMSDFMGLKSHSVGLSQKELCWGILRQSSIWTTHDLLLWDVRQLNQRRWLL